MWFSFHKMGPNHTLLALRSHHPIAMMLHPHSCSCCWSLVNALLLLHAACQVAGYTSVHPVETGGVQKRNGLLLLLLLKVSIPLHGVCKITACPTACLAAPKVVYS